MVFLSSGVGKFYGSSGLMGPGWLFEEMAKYALEPFAVFIAAAEIVIGFCLLSRRLATLGALMCVPLLVNILVVVVSLHWQGTPLVVAGFLAMNGYLIFCDWEKLLPLLQLPGDEVPLFGWRNFKFTLAGLAGLLVVLAGVHLSCFSNEGFRMMTRAGLLVLAGVFIFEFLNWKKSNQPKN